MKNRNSRRRAQAVAIALGWFITLCFLCLLGFMLATSCGPTRRPPAYQFKSGPAYLPGPKPYVHERYPNHP